VIRYAFELAERRRKKVSSVDKANVLTEVYGLWREVFAEEAKAHPKVATEYTFVDAITMWFVKNPECSTWSSRRTCSATSSPISGR